MSNTTWQNIGCGIERLLDDAEKPIGELDENNNFLSHIHLSPADIRTVQQKQEERQPNGQTLTFEQYWKEKGHFGSTPRDVAMLAWNAAKGTSSK